MLSKVWTIFDSRLSNIFTLSSLPPEASRFPLLWQTSIHIVSSKTQKFIKEKGKKYKGKKINRSIIFFSLKKVNTALL